MDLSIEGCLENIEGLAGLDDWAGSYPFGTPLLERQLIGVHKGIEELGDDVVPGLLEKALDAEGGVHRHLQDLDGLGLLGFREGRGKLFRDGVGDVSDVADESVFALVVRLLELEQA